MPNLITGDLINHTINPKVIKTNKIRIIFFFSLINFIFLFFLFRKLIFKNKKNKIGIINRLSPIVDPDTGTVLSFVDLKSYGRPYRIGEVLPIFIEGKLKKCQKVIGLKELGLYTNGYKVNFIAGDKACLDTTSP